MIRGPTPILRSFEVTPISAGLKAIAMLLKRLHNRRAAPWVALGLSGGLLVGAWIFQYGFGYLPCTMCYWQRHAHKAVLGVAALWLILRALGVKGAEILRWACLLYTSPSPRDQRGSRMPSSA